MQRFAGEMLRKNAVKNAVDRAVENCWAVTSPKNWGWIKIAEKWDQVVLYQCRGVIGVVKQ